METKTSHVILYIVFYVRLVILSKHEDEGAALQFHFVWNTTWPSQPTSSQVYCLSDHSPVNVSYFIQSCVLS